MKIWILLLLVTFTRCNSNVTGDCNNHVYEQIDNSKRTFKIVKFDRGCGATTSNSIQLSVIDYNDSLRNEAGNIFIANSKVGMYIERDTSVQASWLNDSTILVRHDKDLEVFKKNSMAGKVNVVYEMK